MSDRTLGQRIVGSDAHRDFEAGRAAGLKEAALVRPAQPTLAWHPAPPVDAVLKCLVCGLHKPWGIFDNSTGAAVCKDCRDKARA